MGGVVSPGRNNEELVDNLCKGGYILTPEVERVFRILDRKDYMEFRNDDEENVLQAYEDHAWKRGNLHLSAPCIYTKALESLKLECGQSFLNLGSGTGYLSTMAGLLLGANGINHGIEIFQDNVEFATEKLNIFKEQSPWYDPVKFCEPYFMVGNALLLSSNGIMYDKIYCGAACPTEHIPLLKNMLKIKGVLILPCESTLEAVTRVSEDEWEQSVILSTVSFAPLILPSATTPKDLTAITMVTEVRSLKELSRLAVLSSLTRSHYHEISTLPLPTHLQQYVSHNRTWESEPAPLKQMCPIDEEERKALQREDMKQGGIMEDRDDDVTIRWNGLPDGGLFVQRVGRQNMLQVNLNGMFFQLPVLSDGSEADEAETEDDAEELSQRYSDRSESETEEQEQESENENLLSDDDDD